ncbi:hypothetical protein BN938_1822 [Mucinivorans hirudinis]|uniref:Uncharacterized protein n=1 Tax=Mucinivorans hirudinis TaxID=1433126 RepID=A0A060R8S9_9BACT|nr:hypothetical protein BN938_1822 [Mucinivorans hirudinis]
MLTTNSNNANGIVVTKMRCIHWLKAYNLLNMKTKIIIIK